MDSSRGRYRGLVRIVLVNILIFLLFAGCDFSSFDFRKVKKVELSPEIAIPLGSANLSMQDLISKIDSMVIFDEEEDGTILLIYEDSLKERSFIDYFDFQDQAFQDTLGLDLPLNITIPNGETIPLLESKLEYQIDFPGDQRFDSLLISKGQMTFKTMADLPGTLYLTMEFPNIQKNGFAQSLDIEIDGNGPGMGQSEAVVSLDDSKLIFNASAGANVFEVIMNSYFVSAGGRISNPDVIFDFSFQFDSLHGIFGYLGNELIPLPQSKITMEFMEIFDRGYINFELPQIKIDVASNIGIPLNVEIGSFYADLNNTQFQSITGGFIDEEYFLSAPTSGDPDDFSISEILVNKDNSNLREVFSEIPSAIFFDFILEMNPEKDITTSNYVLENSKVGGYFSLEMPLKIAIDNLNASDTFAIDTFDIENDLVEWADLFIDFENTIPLGGIAQIKFYKAGSTAESVLIEGADLEITPSDIDADGQLISASSGRININLNKEEIEGILQSNRIIYYVSFNTSNADTRQLVKIKADSFLKTALGIKLKLNIQ